MKKLYLLLVVFLISSTANANDIWYNSYEDAKKEAAKSGKMIFVNFYNPATPYGRHFEKIDFNDFETQLLKRNFVFVSLEVSDEYRERPLLARKYSLPMYPEFMMIFDPNGKMLLQCSTDVTKSQIKKILKAYSPVFNSLHKDFTTYGKEKETRKAIEIASKYLVLSLQYEGKLKSRFIKTGITYLEEVEKEATKAEKQRIALLKHVYACTLKDKDKKALKRLEKMFSKEEIHDENKRLYSFLREHISKKLKNS